MVLKEGETENKSILKESEHLIQSAWSKNTTLKSGADSGLVKLVVMSNVFFNNQQHKIKIKRFLRVKEITSSFFSNSWNQRFYS